MITIENEAVSRAVLVELILVGLMTAAMHFDLVFGAAGCGLLLVYAEFLATRQLRTLNAVGAPERAYRRESTIRG